VGSHIDVLTVGAGLSDIGAAHHSDPDIRCARRFGRTGVLGYGRWLGALVGVLVLVPAGVARGAWTQPVGGVSPINQADNRNAANASLAAIGGVPYVAWTEFDGTNFELRVSRLNAAGTAWEQVVGGASPINNTDNRDAANASLAAIGGVPYVAWTESDGTIFELRVCRLNAAGSAWEQVVGGASPINQANNQNASSPSLTAIGGVPYVAWRESDGINGELRVSRLAADFLGAAAAPTSGGATLIAELQTYGVAHNVTFQFGPGASLSQRSATVSSSADNGTDAVLTTIGGLTPATAYSFRATAGDGTYTTATGATGTFATETPTTVAVPGPTVTRLTLLIAALRTKLTATQGKTVKLDYLATAAGNALLEVFKGKTRVARVTAKAKAGRNTIRWNGRAGRKAASPGKYTLKLRVTSADAQTARDNAALTIKRKPAKKRK